jgi:uncharacterized protein YgiM (DUF1202 family)
MKKCPFCAEEIQDEAIVCRFCGKEIISATARDLAERWGYLSEEERKTHWGAMSESQQRELRAALDQMSAAKPAVRATPAEKPAKRKTSPAAWGCLFLILLLAAIILIPKMFTGPTTTRVRRSTSSPSGQRQPARLPDKSLFAKGAINIRSGPSTSNTVVKKASPGERLDYVDSQGEWFKLKTNESGTEQWVHSSVVMTAAQKRAYDAANLELIDWRWYNEHGYVKVEGRVKNISNSSLKNVTADVTFLTASKELVTSSEALIDFNPIMPGQTSTFSVIETYNPAMKSASITFRTLLGKSINWRKR